MKIRVFTVPISISACLSVFHLSVFPLMNTFLFLSLILSWSWFLENNCLELELELIQNLSLILSWSWFLENNCLWRFDNRKEWAIGE